jgi:CRP-like cAMP-binding protein
MDVVRTSQNRLLASLSQNDWLLLKPHLRFVDLPLKMQLEASNTPIESSFFLSEGIASVVATGKSGHKAEVGLIGREGMTGSAAILGDTQSPHAIFMQIAGCGHQTTIRHLKEAMRKSRSLSDTLTKFVHAFMIQKSQTALVNGKGTIGARLARWLLMAHDRVEGPRFPVTHEFLSLMLGSTRPGVTNALHGLEGQGLIRSKRNEVVILDRAGLETTADWCYGVPEAEYQRIFGFSASVGTNTTLVRTLEGDSD